MALGEAELGEPRQALECALGDVEGHAVLLGPRQELLPVEVDLLAPVLAAHGPPERLGHAVGEVAHGDGHLHHLLLEEHDAEGLTQHLPDAVVRDEVGRVGVGAALDVVVDRPADDGARADDRHLGGQVVEVARLEF